jgi:gliding motility-associated-like protein
VNVKKFGFFWVVFLVFGVGVCFAQTPAVVISSYYNAASPLDEWTELVVIKDNTNMNFWKLQDCDSTQTIWRPAIIFNEPNNNWKHMRAGTIIIIYHRFEGGYGEDVGISDGYLQLAADDHTLFPYFSGGSFGTFPLYNGPTLNIDSRSDMLVLQDSAGNFVHALGHGAVAGPLFNALPQPKLNYNNRLDTGEAVSVCPGANLDEYGNLAPQDGSTWASAGGGANVTFGLPNKCAASATANTDYLRSLRQPDWINPTLWTASNTSNTLVTLNWNSCVDPYWYDGVEHYIILRNTSNVFGVPVDGVSYTKGDNIGGATVVASNFGSSPMTDYIDTVPVPCGTDIYYEIFAFRYGPDQIPGSIYNPARGPAYNETSFASAHITGVMPVAPVAAASDRNTICSNDTGSITLSVTGGSGDILNWYSGSCGGTLIGTGSGPTNNLTIPSPTTTTTYYAAWENNCGVSTCASVTVTVTPSVTVSVTITADDTAFCPGTVVTFTAHPSNEGTTPVYTWTEDGNPVQSGSSPVFITNSLTVGYVVKCRLTSSVNCVVQNPVESSPVTLFVYAPPVVNLTDKPFLCAGEPIQLDAGAGFASYLWQDGSTGRYYTATNAGIYRVTVTDVHACTGSDSVELKSCDSTIFIPTAFSPNGDGENDSFRVVSTADNVSGFSMLIYDRWGALVFQTTDFHSGWNGQLQGRPAPAGTYAWMITYQEVVPSSANPVTVKRHGTVVLVR